MATAVATSPRLAELEATIGRGLETFVEVGEALREIRDSGLYKETHPTFEDYCDQRWEMSRPRAYELMQSATVVSAMADIAPSTPSNERQARELAPLRERPAEMAEAWQEASADGAPTAAKVKQAVERRVEPGRGFTGYSSATDEWATPQDLFDKLDAEFKFELDVCALDSSAKCPTYFTPETDGLNQDWKNFRCWMNPPYGDVIGEWMAKAADAAGKGATVVCLVPARVDTGWWWDYCLFGEIRFLRGRLKFGGSKTGAPFPSALVIFGEGFPPRVKWWNR
jgi:phage N-6-adenine-methyltransferase